MEPRQTDAMKTKERRIQALALAAAPGLEADLLAITAIPAPTFHEAKRAHWLRQRWREAGAPSVTVDAVGNVRARIPGRRGQHLYVLAAHMDTVFDQNVSIELRRQGDRLLAPGCGDNSAGLAVLSGLVDILSGDGPRLDADLMLVGTVGEEGLGNLRGARYLVQELGRRLTGFLAVDGSLGSLVLTGVGSRRFRLEVSGKGGHSWADHGHTNPAHVLAELITRFYRSPRPTGARSTINVSDVHAPGSVNSIPTTASGFFEIRSTSADALASLADGLAAVVREQRANPAVKVELEDVGQRPAGRTAPDHPLALTLNEAFLQSGIRPTVEAASTDANAAMAQGIPAAAVGIRQGGGAHTLAEFVEIPSLKKGLSLLLRGVLALDRNRHHDQEGRGQRLDDPQGEEGSR